MSGKSENPRAFKSGIELIAAERQRQISEEGWTPEHDDQHEFEELAAAAASYACPQAQRTQKMKYNGITVRAFMWPWEPDWWKPTPNDRIRELEKAGALIAAEIDRLQRQRTKPKDSQ